MSKISIVVAATEEGVIGYGGNLLCRLPQDMKRFVSLTTGHKVVMGRKTWDSIPARFRPLSNRTNVVMSTTMPATEGVIVCRSWEEVEALILADNKDDKEVFVIGGGEIYLMALPVASKIYRTLIHENIPGDTFFPCIDEKCWDLQEKTSTTDDGGHPTSFEVWRRRY